MKVTYRIFQPSDIRALYPAFISAFSDYFVRLQPPITHFRTRIFEKLHIQPELSMIALESSRVIGFILHTSGLYEGQQTIYNGGMGVIQEFRKQHIATRLYENIAPALGRSGAKRIILEVIKTNQKAISYYEKLGFNYKQTFKCFKLHKDLKAPKENNIRIVKSVKLKATHLDHQDFEPAFLDTHQHLKFNLANEVILEAIQNEELLGHLIFQPASGRISQLAVNPKQRNKQVGSSLLFAAQQLATNKQLTAMNIPEDQQETTSALVALGFVNELDQYEMELII